MTVPTFDTQLRRHRLEKCLSLLRVQQLPIEQQWFGLFLACQDGRDVVEALAMGADPNAKDAEGGSLLAHAIGYMGEDCLRALLEGGLDPNQLPGNLRPPTFVCIRHRAIKKFRALLEAGMYPGVSWHGKNPLFFALEEGVHAIARDLMSRGYDPAELDASGRTPLHAFLVKTRRSSGVDTAWVASQLLAASDLDALDGQGKSCRIIIAELLPRMKRSPWDLAVSGMLESALEGREIVLAVPDLRPLKDATPLTMRASGNEVIPGKGVAPEQWITHAKGLRGVREALRNGADINQEDDRGRTALWLMANKGGKKSVIYLLQRGARVNVIDRATGSSEVHVACQRNAPELLQALLAAGSDPSAANCNGETPLHHACRWGQVEMASGLISAGVDIHVSDKRGNTALHHLVLHANEANLLALAGLLMDAGLDPNTRNCYGKTAQEVLDETHPSQLRPVSTLRSFLPIAQVQFQANQLSSSTIDAVSVLGKARRI